MQVSSGRIRVLFFFSLFLLIPAIIGAQDDNFVSVSGSGIVTPLIEALIDAGQIDTNIEITVTGTRTGFSQLCGGDSDVVTANRPISVSEDAACAANGVHYLELLIGHSVLAVIANPEAEINTCLTGEQLNSLFAPSSEGALTNWNEINVDNPDIELTLVVPPENNVTLRTLDNLIEGNGIRGDVSLGNNNTDIIAAVSNLTGGVGVVAFSADLASNQDVRVLELDTVGLGCTAPSAEAIEGRTYAASDRLLIYINAGRLDSPGIQSLAESVLADSAATIIEGAGFVTPTAAAYTRGREIVANAELGRQFSLDVVNFDIPDNLSGILRIGGSSYGRTYIDSLTTAFAATYSSVIPNVNLFGESAALGQVCDGTLDVVFVFDTNLQDDAVECDGSEQPVYNVNLGVQAIVLLRNANQDLPDCLSTQQIEMIWRADSADSIVNWNQASEEFADIEFAFAGPLIGDVNGDLLMSLVSDSPVPLRLDYEEIGDPTERAEAVTDDLGGLTFMSWEEYQLVLASDVSGFEVVEVSSGDNCIAPDEVNILDGDYPLAASASLLITDSGLQDLTTRSFLWSLASDSSFAVYEASGFTGVQFADLPALRVDLQRAFAQADAESAEAPADDLADDVSDDETDADPPEASEESSVDLINSDKDESLGDDESQDSSGD